MKDLQRFIIEGRTSDVAIKPFETHEELMKFIDEVEKTKIVIMNFENEAQAYWDQMAKAQREAEKEFKKSGADKLTGDAWHEKYDEIFQKKYKIDEWMEKASDVMKDPECVAANKKLYGELQQRALDSLSTKEQKAIGKRGGRLYNILNEVLKKYTHWDYKKNCPT